MAKVDKSKCIGCGACTSVCSEVFKMGKDGKAEAKAGVKKPCIKEAVDICPVQAISAWLKINSKNSRIKE